ncbi:MAG: histidine kinase, partial [Actinomycetota bacterium]
ARGDERQQLRWFVFGAVLVVLALAATIPFGYIGSREIPKVLSVVTVLAFSTVPVFSGIAILRYRLYDIDLVLNKAVVYALLGAFITLIYVGVVAGVGTAIGNRGSVFLSAVAAGLAALAFQPVRRRAQALANRLVYGERATPYEVLSRFSERLGEAYSVDDVLPRMARIVAEGTTASPVHVWLRLGDRLRPAAAWPERLKAVNDLPLEGDDLPDFGGPVAFAVRHQGDLLGAITVEPRAGEPFTPIQRRLVEDVSSQAGLVLQNVRLTAELRARLEEISRQAAELRASRQRLVAAQDEERRRLERNIHDGAQQQIVAIGVKLGLARALVDRDPVKATQVLTELHRENQEALETLRDLARGIYPPLLADHGLAAALEAQARKSPVPVSVDADGVGRFPQEVEAAAYFVILEAIQNVAKYAKAGAVTIRLAAADGELRLAVVDDGAGFDPSTVRRGSGLSNMGDRLAALGGALDVRSSPGGGTTVEGRIPIATRTEAP